MERLVTGRLREAIYNQHVISRKNKNESWDCYYCVFGEKERINHINTNGEQISQEKMVPWDLGLKIWWRDEITQTNQA